MLPRRLFRAVLLGVTIAGCTPVVAAEWPGDTGRTEMRRILWPTKMPVAPDQTATYFTKNKLFPIDVRVINRQQFIIGIVCVSVVGSALLLYGVRSR